MDSPTDPGISQVSSSLQSNTDTSQSSRQKQLPKQPANPKRRTSSFYSLASSRHSDHPHRDTVTESRKLTFASDTHSEKRLSRRLSAKLSTNTLLSSKQSSSFHSAATGRYSDDFESIISDCPDCVQVYSLLGGFTRGPAHTDDSNEASTSTTSIRNTSERIKHSRSSLLQKFRKTLANFEFMHKHKIKKLTKQEKSAQQWSGRFDFSLCDASLVVGFGNLVYSPLTLQRHGALPFLIAYVTICLLLGYSMLLLEVGLGQFCSRGPGGCWEFARLFKGVGYVMILWVWVIIMASIHRSMWGLVLQYQSLFAYPWEASAYHIYSELQEHLMASHENHSHQAGDTEHGDHENHSHQTGDTEHGDHVIIGGDVVVGFCCNWLIILLFLLPDIQTRGKVISSLFLAVAASICLLSARAMALPGAMTGVRFAFSPRPLTALLDTDLWLSAVHRCFFSLDLTPGYHMTLASYNHFHNQIMTDVLFVFTVDFIFFIVGVFFSFSILGHLAHMTKNMTLHFKLEEISAESGASVVLLKIPRSLSLMEHGYAWVFFFFTFSNLMMQLNLTTKLETLVTGVMDALQVNYLRRKYAVVGVVCVSVPCSLWMTTVHDVEVMQMIAHYFSPLFSPVIALAMVGAVMGVIGVDRFLAKIECIVGWDTSPLLSNYWWKLWWKFCYRFVSPSLYLVIVVMHLYGELTRPVDHSMAAWATVLGRSLWACLAAVIVGTVTWLVLTNDQPGLKAKVLDLLTPTQRWGPALPQNRFIVQVGQETRLKELEDAKTPTVDTVTTFHDLSVFGETM